jgi:hypothetical protein
MSIILARLDLEEIFCDVDDFYQVWERFGTTLPQLPHDGEMKQYNSRLVRFHGRETRPERIRKLSISEVMTITIAFHALRFSDFQRILQAASVTPLGLCVSSSGQLYPLCGIDALEFNGTMELLEHL